MPAKKMNKKVILVLKLSELGEQGRLNKMGTVQAANVANPIITGLDPTAAAVGTKLTAAQGLLNQRDSLMVQLKNTTEQYHQTEDELNTIFNRQWPTQTEKVIGNDAAQGKLLGWEIKGDVETAGIPRDSAPVIIKIEVLPNGVQILHIKDNITGSIKMPKGISQIHIYGQTGGTRPADLTQLITNGGGYLGQAKRGKFEIQQPSGSSAKIEYFIAVYIEKATLKPFSQSAVESAVIS